MTNGRPQTQIALRIAKNGPEPKVREAKWAADHKNQGNNRSAEGRCRASGRTCYAVAAKTVKNRGALKYILESSELIEKYLDRLAYSEAVHRFNQVRRVAHLAIAKSSWTATDKVEFLVEQFRKESDQTNRGIIADKLSGDFGSFPETVKLFRNLSEAEAADIEFNETSQKYILSIEG